MNLLSFLGKNDNVCLVMIRFIKSLIHKPISAHAKSHIPCRLLVQDITGIRNMLAAGINRIACQLRLIRTCAFSPGSI